MREALVWRAVHVVADVAREVAQDEAEELAILLSVYRLQLQPGVSAEHVDIVIGIVDFLRGYSGKTRPSAPKRASDDEELEDEEDPGDDGSDERVPQSSVAGSEDEEGFRSVIDALAGSALIGFIKTMNNFLPAGRRSVGVQLSLASKFITFPKAGIRGLCLEAGVPRADVPSEAALESPEGLARLASLLKHPRWGGCFGMLARSVRCVIISLESLRLCRVI